MFNFFAYHILDNVRKVCAGVVPAFAVTATCRQARAVWPGRALRTLPVEAFSEGARRQGRNLIEFIPQTGPTSTG